MRTLPLLAAVLLLTGACGSLAKPEGWAAPRLQDGTLYVTLEHGKLDAYRLSDRQRLWEFPTGNAKLPLTVKGGHNLPAPAPQKLTFEAFYGNPVVADDGVYVTGYSGHVVALNPNGAARWVDELSGRTIGGALVSGDTVYAGTTSGDLFALARDTGLVRWQTNVGKDIWSTPVAAGNVVVVSAMNGDLIAFDHDGNQAWTRHLSDAGIASTPALDGSHLYVGSFDKRIYAVNAADGSVIWNTNPLDNWFWTNILVQGDTLYAGSLGGWVYALGAANGDVKWSRQVGNAVRSRPALVNGVLVVGSKDGRMHGLTPATGDPVWSQPASPPPDDPAVARGDLYADLLPSADQMGVYFSTEGGRSAGTLYFLNVADVTNAKVSEIALNTPSTAAAPQGTPSPAP